MFWNRFFIQRPTSPPVLAPGGGPYACAELDALPRPLSPLVGEAMKMYCHSRSIGALSQDESCPDEYRMVARSLIHHILEGWQNQTRGHGTIDDLLLQPRTHAATETASTPADRNTVSQEHGLAY